MVMDMAVTTGCHRLFYQIKKSQNRSNVCRAGEYLSVEVLVPRACCALRWCWMCVWSSLWAGQLVLVDKILGFLHLLVLRQVWNQHFSFPRPALSSGRFISKGKGAWRKAAEPVRQVEIHNHHGKNWTFSSGLCSCWSELGVKPWQEDSPNVSWWPESTSQSASWLGWLQCAAEWAIIELGSPVHITSSFQWCV